MKKHSVNPQIFSIQMYFAAPHQGLDCVYKLIIETVYTCAAYYLVQ